MSRVELLTFSLSFWTGAWTAISYARETLGPSECIPLMTSSLQRNATTKLARHLRFKISVIQS